MPSIPLTRELIPKKDKDKENKRVKVLKLLGAKCFSCGYDKDIRCLDFDHIFGDACLEKSAFNPDQIYSMIIKAFQYNITDALTIIGYRYQILCCNCHRIKTIENEENGPNSIFRMASNIGCIEQVRILRNIIEEHIRKDTRNVL